MSKPIEHPTAREILAIIAALPADDSDIYYPVDVATAADRHALSYGDLRTLQRQIEQLERATRWASERPRSSCAREMRDQAEHQGACNTQEDDLLRWAFALEALSERLLAADQRIEQLERERAAAPILATLGEWAHQMGRELVPRAGWQDTFGDGMRAAKAQVAAILSIGRART